MIQSHKELAKFIKGKKILHLNSLGKDCAVTLEWLNEFAEPAEIISVYFKYFWSTQADQDYLNYQRERYPKTKFIEEPNASDLTNILNLYQSPIDVVKFINHLEFEEFEMTEFTLELLQAYEFDHAAIGFSKYESVSRASFMYKKGLHFHKFIYPIGLLKKKEIYDIIESRKLKLHPHYKFVSTSPDYPSYYKLRSLMIAKPEFKEAIFKYYPLLQLDQYRWEKLLNV